MKYKFISVLGGSELASFETNDMDAANLLRGVLGLNLVDDPIVFCGIHSGDSRDEADYTLDEIMSGAEAIVVAINVKDSSRGGIVFLVMTAARMKMRNIGLCTVIAY